MARANLSFERGDSLFHQMTPFSKLLFILSISFVAIFNTNIYVGVGLFLLCFFVASLCTGVPLKKYWVLGRIILPFILILAVVFPFFYGGQATTGSDIVAITTPFKDFNMGGTGFWSASCITIYVPCFGRVIFCFHNSSNRYGAESFRAWLGLPFGSCASTWLGAFSCIFRIRARNFNNTANSGSWSGYKLVKKKINTRQTSDFCNVSYGFAKWADSGNGAGHPRIWCT